MLTVYSRSGNRSPQEWFSTLIYIKVFERGQEGVGGDDELGLRVMEVEMSHSHKGSPEWVWVQLTWFCQLGH